MPYFLPLPLGGVRRPPAKVPAAPRLSRRRGAAWLLAALLPGLLLPGLLLYTGPLAASPGVERLIRHDQGETRLRGTPLRVVTLFQGATDSAVALGVTPVGVVEAWRYPPVYPYLRPALAGVAQVGLESQPNLELIAALRPDLIVASSRRHARIYPLLSRIAPTVALAGLSDFKQTLALMGQALNRQARAEALLTQWEGRAANLRRQLPERLGAAWPPRVTLANLRADHARIYLPQSFAGAILAELGFLRPAGQPRQRRVLKLATEEGIPALDADLLFLFMDRDDPAVERTHRRWSRHPLWRNLAAVRAGQVFEVDEVAWNLGGGILAAQRMLDQIYHHYGLSGPRGPALAEGV